MTHTVKSRVRESAARLILMGVLALAACDADLAPPFSFTGTGNLEGLVFFDVAEDGVFDPADGDLALEGVALSARIRDTESVFAGGETQSDANGRFQLAGLPLGTHDLRIDTLTVPASVSICQNPIRFSISADETRFQSIQGRAACLITIAEAKEQGLDAFVIVRGVLTSDPGQVHPSRTYIEDATTGILIFDGVFAATLAGLDLGIGDVVELGATTTAFRTEFELISATLRESVPGGDSLDPHTVTTADVAAIDGPGNLLQGRLIRVENAQLTVAFGAPGTGDEKNAFIDDGSGVTLVRVEDGVLPEGELNTTFAVGKCYDINGFGASFDGSGQIFPRSLDDFVEVPCN